MAATRKTVLIVTSDSGTRPGLGALLRDSFRVLVAGSGEAALALMEREEVDLMLLDLELPGIGGLDTLRIVRENHPSCDVVVWSTGDLETAVSAMKYGAYHCVPGDVDNQSVQSLLMHAAERQLLSRQVLRLSAEVSEQTDRELVVGPSRATRAVLEMVHKVARLSATVLILGESGTGKELLARHIHRESDPEAPFVAVNLAAIPPDLVESVLFGHEKGAFTGAIRQQIGKFELAAGGTLFLDEVGDLRLDLQAKLLRAIQEGEVERVGGSHPIKTAFRLLAATNVDLERAVKEGRFREDLYYRLNVIPVRLPPLRERREDIGVLVRFFLDRYNRRFRKQVQGVADSAMAMLTAYHWPGNIRELENMVERLVAVTDSDWIADEDLPFEFHEAYLSANTRASENRLERALDAFERTYLVRELEKCSWNVSATARDLGIPLSTLKFKMDRLEIRDLAKRIRGKWPPPAPTPEK